MSNPRYNQKLFQLVVSGLAGLGEKQSFTPAPQIDPQAQAQGGGQPQDPLAAMGAPPTGQQQMDPGMMAALQQQGGGQPQPGMAPDGLPANEQPQEEAKPDPSDIKTEIRNVLTEAGVIKPPKLKPEDHFLWTKSAIEKICKQLGIDAPPLPDTSNTTMKNGTGAMTAGMSGGPSDQALGSMQNQPLDPAQQAAVGGGDPSMAKAANISTKSASIREALQRLRK